MINIISIIYQILKQTVNSAEIERQYAMLIKDVGNLDGYHQHNKDHKVTALLTASKIQNSGNANFRYFDNF